VNCKHNQQETETHSSACPTSREINFILLSNKMEYDRDDNFLVDLEPNGSRFGAPNQKENVSV